MDYPQLWRLGLSLALGLLVGIQRERSDSALAGMRTFPLITVLGSVCALLSLEFGGWIIAAGLVAAGLVVVVTDVSRFSDHRPDAGSTTEFAILLMYGVGAYAMIGPWVVASAVAGAVAVLLQFKPQLHGFAARLGDRDLSAIMRFVLISMIVLPALPDETYGPLAVFNPFQIWLMVVLIVGISLVGYLLYKFLGADAGVILGGILGGAISSTATTVSCARRGAPTPSAARASAVVVMIAAAVVFVRVLIEISAVAPGLFPLAVWPLSAMALCAAVPAAVLWSVTRHDAAGMPQQENPTELRTAVAFGLGYTLVLFCLAAAQRYLGGQALYVVAGMSGLADVDAITLSSARLVADGAILPQQGWQMVVVATMANLAAKTAIVGLLGPANLARRVALLMALPFAAGAALLAGGDWVTATVTRVLAL